MDNLKTIFSIMMTNFNKWSSSSKIITLAVFIVIFTIFHLQGLVDFLRVWEVQMMPWIFSHYIGNVIVLLSFGVFTTLLFCDAPFIDQHTPFLIMRSGRKNWIMGQILYIVVASFLYTVFINIVVLLPFLKHLKLSLEWGDVFFTLAREGHLLSDNINLMVSPAVLTALSPIEAFFLSFSLFWLVSIFIGILIFSLNTIVKKASGLFAMGFFLFMVPFSLIVGRIRLSFGNLLSYLSPLNWWSLSLLDLDGTANFPSLNYALVTLFLSILTMSLITIKVFCLRDVSLKGEDS